MNHELDPAVHLDAIMQIHTTPQVHPSMQASQGSCTITMFPAAAAMCRDVAYLLEDWAIQSMAF